MRRVAAVAATGDHHARIELQMLVDEERRARAEGREPGVIARLSTLRVLRRTNPRPPGAKEIHDG